MKSWADDPVDVPEKQPEPKPAEASAKNAGREEKAGGKSSKGVSSSKAAAVSDSVASPMWQKRAAQAVQREKEKEQAREQRMREQRLQNTPSSAANWRSPQASPKHYPPAPKAAVSSQSGMALIHDFCNICVYKRAD